MAVAVPTCGEDVAILADVNSHLIPPFALVARGGGTGTNGQSLTNGIVVDTKRYCNQILEIDPERLEAVVEPGVVLDELNEALSPFGLFFAPHVSTSSRATVGGMVATDAAGKGSMIHGRTNDHVISLDVVLADGTQARFVSSPRPTLTKIQEQTPDGRISELSDSIDAALASIDVTSLASIERGFTGYNLGDATTDSNPDITKLICGSEGTLALVTSIRLRLTAKPTFTQLAVVGFDTFIDAIKGANKLKETGPSAIECLDERTLRLARTSPFWGALERSFDETKGSPNALLLLEYQDPRGLGKLRSLLGQRNETLLSVATEPQHVDDIWKIRKDAVGLLGQQVDGRRAVAFVEDCAVPPDRMPGFIADFRALLDSHQLTYGMFGHADVGCVHVRPALDLYQDKHQALLRTISDQVAELVRDYDGVLWGEHGRGFRGEYVDLTPDLHHRMRQVKTAFDPTNILNPHKLYTPLPEADLPTSTVADETVIKMDRVPLRVTQDKTVKPAILDEFEQAFACNGNGICHHWGAAETMCPSYKVTADPLMSPKGRADLFRAWAADLGNDDLKESLTESLSACLSCNACTGRCPVSVDIPELKSKFLDRHPDDRGVNRLRHWLLGRFESLLPVLRRLGPLGIAGQRLGAPLLERALGLCDLPTTRPFDAARFASMNVPILTKPIVAEETTVVVLPDAFTLFFEPHILEATAFVLQAIGENPALGPFLPSGKYYHVKGFRSRFLAAARKQRELVEALQTQGVDIVVVEPAVQALYSHEYPLIDSGFPSEAVTSLPAYLEPRMSSIDTTTAQTDEAELTFFGHCTETSMRPDHERLYTDAFGQVGLKVQTVTATCCGMAGIFGHERENQKMSSDIFERYWRDAIATTTSRYRCAPGFSCRSQATRFGGPALTHPIEALATHLGF